nr:transglutaminase domain-containing protein [Cytobacillus eiseniae]
MYLFVHIMLWEWLRPLEQLTDTSNIGVFLLFILLSFLLAFMGTSLLVSIGIKMAYIVWMLHFLYFEESIFQLSWISQFVHDVIENIQILFARDWSSLSNIFRSLLFFILLWLMTYLIQYWLIKRRQILLFFLLTLIYITVLDTFTPYDAGLAIVRTVISGFTVLGMLTFYRLLEKEVIQIKTIPIKKWMYPLLIMIAMSVGFGLASPKAEPIWPDPVPYIKSYGKDSGTSDGKGLQKIGYGLDDSNLGGPFIGDNTVIFNAEANSRHYWKVETKDVYTGKGWVTSSSRDEREPFGYEELVPIQSYNNDAKVEIKEEVSTVFSMGNDAHIVYPLGIKQIIAAPFYTFEKETATEKIHSIEGNIPVSIEQYSLVFDKPSYSVTALNEASSVENVAADRELIDHYTMLPDDLPSRIRDLAIEITEDKDSWFEKTREIEGYFRKSGFSYDQLDVAVPGPDDDYVDQFLFDTKRGYCDNFSTSMVILARSIGIPARWVKGYTEGEYKGLGDTGSRMFEVTNNNAHSWVEVYFPGVGWVPFEPTQGFSNSVQFNFDTYLAEDRQPEAIEQEEIEREKPELADKNENKTVSAFSFEKLFDRLKDLLTDHWKWIVSIILVIAFLVFLIYHFRGRWLPFYLAWRFKWTRKDENLPKAYLLLLRELGRYGLHRKEGQTLRDYADYVDRFFSSSEMGRLTTCYEQLIYRGELKAGSWEETKELWENLIKKTIA